MSHHLLIAVHLHADGMGTARYHGMYQGAPEWPPSPARVYQALVAGVARGHVLPHRATAALQWLESLAPPVIAAPARRLGQAVSVYVPNNDADALDDPTDVSGIRAAKQVQPSLFDGAQPLLYAWGLSAGSDVTARLNDTDLCVAGVLDAAQSLYQLGRGVDMAWADARVIADDELQALLLRHRGVVHRPAPAVAAPPMLACPMSGSLRSLMERHHAPRLQAQGHGRKQRVLFTNPPKPRFAAVSYAPAQQLALYDLRERGRDGAWPWPLEHAVRLVEQVRDAAAARLRSVLPEAADVVERCVIGRAADADCSVPLTQRLQIVPLPSIGSVHTDPSIRRVLVSVPTGCPLAPADVDWAFSGLDRIDAQTGEASPWMLTRADRADMQKHYTAPSRHWQSITAVALPPAAARRRIDPAQQRAEPKSADERMAEQTGAEAAVRQALRHSGVPAVATQVRVQREPFTGKGRRAEAFANGSRFAKERLWHVAVSFDRPVAGPLVLGDGRFLGLGVMAPAVSASGYVGDPAAWTGEQADGVMALSWLRAADDALVTMPDDRAVVLARAFRRAVLARVRDAAGLRASVPLNRYFSGHAPDSAGPDRQRERHMAFHWDEPRQRWLVLAPHRLERRAAHGWEREHLELLDRAMEGMTELRAGAAGRHGVRRAALAADDPLLAAATEWESVTPYAVTRHRREASAHDALIVDLLAECIRYRLPVPEVTVLAVQGIEGRGLQGRLRLRFAVPVVGPMALGRTSLLGGGLFASVGAQG